MCCETLSRQGAAERTEISAVMDLNLFFNVILKTLSKDVASAHCCICALKLASCLKVLNIVFSVGYGQHTADRLEEKHSSNWVLHYLCVFWKPKYWISAIIWEGANGKQGAL